MFGCDLISLGKSRVLAVIDFQPLHPTFDYSLKYIEPLGGIRNKYPDMHGTLSGKIYDDTSFFSKNMLFGRFTDESKIDSVVSSSFHDYLAEYMSLANSASPITDPNSIDIVRQRQTAFEDYSALKDPAVGLFATYFGKAWADEFVHNFLFPLSKKEDSNRVHNFEIQGDKIVTKTSKL
jgi:15,16-dihydrobiliverdin:ferredoxin oxidoreductase